MNVLTELQKRARTFANSANPANPARLRLADSQDSQDSQGVQVETALCPAPAADPAVRVLRARLLELADRLGIDGAHVHRLPSADLALWAAIPGGSLRAYLVAADDTATRQAGKVPLDDTAPIYCQYCGPVYVHPSIAAVLPVVDGWPRALGCPWCAIRKASGTIPRPHVTCATCASYRPDTINPAAGVGDCASGQGTHYPMQRYSCEAFKPSGIFLAPQKGA
jgi:hypothetical protein